MTKKPGQNQDHKLVIRQSWIDIDKLPKETIKAILLIEDPDFLNHKGISWESVTTAFQKNLLLKSWAFGASTISQQAAKNLFLSSDRTLYRKFKEFALTCVLEKVLTKKRILEIYLNIADWGPGIFGLEEASRFWYKKSASNLTALESVSLAYLLQFPLSKTPYCYDEIGEATIFLVSDYMKQDRGIFWADIKKLLETRPSKSKI